MHDPRCEELALVFLPDRWYPARAAHAADLAETIQTAIEDWFDAHVRDVERACATYATDTEAARVDGH